MAEDSSSLSECPAFSTTTATTASTQRGCGTPIDSDFRNRRQTIERLFDLAAGDILAAGLDHVLLAVDDGDIALLVDGGEIAGMEPAALEGGRRAFVVVEIAEHQMRRAMHDLADLAGRHVAHIDRRRRASRR